jgi:hypothetical protein
LYNIYISLTRFLYFSILYRESSSCFFLLDLAFSSLGLDRVLSCIRLVLGLVVEVYTVLLLVVRLDTIFGYYDIEYKAILYCALEYRVRAILA